MPKTTCVHGDVWRARGRRGLGGVPPPHRSGWMMEIRSLRLLQLLLHMLLYPAWGGGWRMEDGRRRRRPPCFWPSPRRPVSLTWTIFSLSLCSFAFHLWHLLLCTFSCSSRSDIHLSFDGFGLNLNFPLWNYQKVVFSPADYNTYNTFLIFKPKLNPNPKNVGRFVNHKQNRMWSFVNPFWYKLDEKQHKNNTLNDWIHWMWIWYRRRSKNTCVEIDL